MGSSDVPNDISSYNERIYNDERLGSRFIFLTHTPPGGRYSNELPLKSDSSENIF